MERETTQYLGPFVELFLSKLIKYSVKRIFANYSRIENIV